MSNPTELLELIKAHPNLPVVPMVGSDIVADVDMDMSPEDKIIKALEAAEQYCCGVQRPFHLLCTDGREEIVVR